MNSTILKPSTGTNYYYAQKHGEPIRNVLDNVLAGACESYQPTGATNSLDALEMLCKGTAPDFSRPAPTAPSVEPPQAKEFAPQPADYGSTFGMTARSPRVETAPAPAPEPAPVDMEWALAPGHGWSAQDSQRQNQALYYCGGDDHSLKQVVSKGFNESTRLGESSFNRSGIAAGLFIGAAVAGVAGLALVASPLVGLALVGGAVVATFEAIHQVDWSHRDNNNSAILRDMATRLDQADRHMIGERPENHGNYLADFTLARGWDPAPPGEFGRMSGPTPSPATNELLALAAAGSPDLKAKATQRLAETRQALAHFLAQEHPAGFADEVAEIEARFTAYAAALEGLAAGRDESLALQEASLALRKAMNFYEDEQLSRGPTRFRPYNLILNLSLPYREGKVDPAAWRGTCEHWAHFHRKVIEEIDASTAAQDPGVPQRRASAAKAVQAMETLAEGKDFDGPLALFLEAHEGLEASLAQYNDFALGSGPTPSPQANLVLHLARGRFEPETLKTAAQAMHAKVQAGLAEFQRLTREPVDAPVLLEQYPKMLAALETLDDTLHVILSEVNDRALQEFEAAAVRLHEATQAIQHYQETLGKIPCPNCQAYNLPGTRFCEGCQRSLPQVATGAGYGSVASTLQVMEGAEAEGLPVGPIFTEKMKVLNDACIALDRGELELEAFLDLLDRCEAECNAAEDGLAHLRAPEIPEEATEEEGVMAQEFVDLAEDALSLLSYGVGECLAGLQQLRACAEEGRGVVAMEEGARVYFEGIQKLYQVERLDEGFQRTLRSLKV